MNDGKRREASRGTETSLDEGRLSEAQWTGGAPGGPAAGGRDGQAVVEAVGGHGALHFRSRGSLQCLAPARRAPVVPGSSPTPHTAQLEDRRPQPTAMR
jgi:hypothetical protein